MSISDFMGDFYFKTIGIMDFLEKDLETIIWEASDEKLEERGLTLNGKRFRQLRIGNYGIADLITVERYTQYNYIDKSIIDSFLIITIYELKKDRIGISAFLQACNYVKGIKTYLENRGYEKVIFRISLIGKTVDTSGSFIYLTDLFGFEMPDLEDFYNYGQIQSVEYKIYNYDIDGISFTSCWNYNLKNTGF